MYSHIYPYKCIQYPYKYIHVLCTWNKYTNWNKIFKKMPSIFGKRKPQSHSWFLTDEHWFLVTLLKIQPYDNRYIIVLLKLVWEAMCELCFFWWCQQFHISILGRQLCDKFLILNTKGPPPPPHRQMRWERQILHHLCILWAHSCTEDASNRA